MQYGKRSKILAYTAILAATALPLAGCVAAGPREMNAVLRDYSITLGESSVSPGKLKLDIKNLSDHNEHELEIFRTDLDPGNLPVKNGKVDSKAQGLEKIVEKHVKGGKTATMATDLGPGKYVIICNIRTHYQRGMHAGLDVK